MTSNYLNSVKLPERPAFLRYSPISYEVLVTTYQLSNENDRIGSFYILDSEFNIRKRIPSSGGIFRFNFFPYCLSKAYAALTTGKIGILDLSSYQLLESRKVSEGMLLNLEYKNSHLLASNENGKLILVDAETFQEISTWDAHNLPGTSTSTKCEVWSCTWLDDNICASGADDTLLKIWDLRAERKPTSVNKSHDGGVVFLEKRNEYDLISGSYDEHIRLFDYRNSKEPVIVTQTCGGAWSVIEAGEYNIVACMYGGWQVLDKGFNVIHTQDEHGSNLLYGADAKIQNSENLIVSTCTFNDFMVYQDQLVL